jgi:hypothetical protein
MRMRYLATAISALLLSLSCQSSVPVKGEHTHKQNNPNHGYQTFGKYEIPVLPTIRERLILNIKSDGDGPREHCDGNLWIEFYIPCNDCTMHSSAFHRIYRPEEEVPEDIETQNISMDILGYDLFLDDMSFELRMSNNPCKYHLRSGTGFPEFIIDPDCYLNGNEYPLKGERIIIE